MNSLPYYHLHNTGLQVHSCGNERAVCSSTWLVKKYMFIHVHTCRHVQMYMLCGSLINCVLGGSTPLQPRELWLSVHVAKQREADI